MRSRVVPAIRMVALLLVGACVPAVDAAHHAVSLTPPYSDLPAAPGARIEKGTRMPLDARQQERVVTGVAKWMKDPRSVQFGGMTAARDSHGVITVCGEVSGRNSAGAYVALEPYVGVLMGPSGNPEFVVVAIAGSGRERAEVSALCREAGAAP
jgi:hypothetical protein